MRKTLVNFHAGRDRDTRHENKINYNATGFAGKSDLHILFGSRTGNSRSAAELAFGYARHIGLKSHLVDITDMDFTDFSLYRNILLAVSTHGEGDPPAAAQKFYDFIHSPAAPEMHDVRFSILALGDSSYKDFCKTGNDFRKRFLDLGASEAYPVVECDIDYEEKAMGWVREGVDVFRKILPGTKIIRNKGFAFEIKKRDEEHEKAYYARVIEKRLLTKPGYEKRTLHLALSVEDYPEKFYPGDSFGVYMSNSRLLVDTILKESGFDGTITVNSVKGRKLLKEALINDVEITMLTPVVVSRYAGLSGNRELVSRVQSNGFLDEYSRTNDLLDLIRDFPSDISPEDLLSILRKLAPRLYSVASSPLAFPGELHFTAGLIEYNANNREHRGVCSVFFADRIEVGDSIPLVLEKNEKFRLPGDDSCPVIMIGTGTGIAPFRAFLQHRYHCGAKGENWLFFGDRHMDSDFLYRDEIENFLKSGLLTRLDTAFSRDSTPRRYIQHHLLEHSKEIFDWIHHKNAVIYVCGNKRTMGQDVKLCLEQIIEQEGRISAPESIKYLQNLKSENRYQTDLY
jgi:sulfite reductase (NADPH) flavoprotein alpha-component